MQATRARWAPLLVLVLRAGERRGGGGQSKVNNFAYSIMYRRFHLR